MAEPMPGKPNDFIVRLDGMKLDDATRHRVASAIQSAVLGELGRLDLGGQTGVSTILVHTPKEWLGKWLREVHGPGPQNPLQGIDARLGVTEQR